MPHVDLVGNRPFVAVFADDVLLEEPVRAVVRCGGQADQVGVEVLDHLPPHVVDGTVAFVDDDHVEIFRRDSGIVDDGQRLPWSPLPLGRMIVVGAFRQFLSLQRGVHALDSGDDDLAVTGDVGRGEPLDVVKLGELAVVIAGDERHELLLGLLAQVAGVDEKEDAAGVRVLEKAVDLGDRGEGLARAGRHLEERAGPVSLE